MESVQRARLSRGVCKLCHAPVVWARHASTRKPAPLVEPPAGVVGNIVLLTPSVYTIAKPLQYPGATRWINHHMDCRVYLRMRERAQKRRA